ncbi:RNA pseudouridine synthase 3, mitochondrial [Dichanthelium oligosanthes]|uniref:RNA pseudouridine synthase 3, mitochondrial n=1 Tax=Dichanthelium oligosanthes TaxID=888268 RepID=A0A1E5WG88_9POAL|nr:RNA pseudouridine synthase 3, mitochondrial [Dichanthelium oligosanthes]
MLCSGGRRPGPWRWPAALRRLSRLAPPTPAGADPAVVRVDSSNVARLGAPKAGPRPRQLLSLPPFPAGTDPLPGRKVAPRRVTAVSWVKHYFADVPQEAVQAHFNRRMSPFVSVSEIKLAAIQVFSECSEHEVSAESIRTQKYHLKKIKHNDVMEPGMRIHLAVSMAEGEIKKRYETIPTATLHPNKDEIEYLRRLVIHRDSAMLVLNKPPKVPMKGHLPVHNSMDVLAAAALSYGNEEGPKLVLLDDGKAERVILAHPSGIDGAQEAITEYRVMGPTINGCSWIELRPLTGRKHQLRVHCAEALGTPIVGDYKYGWFVHQMWKQNPQPDFEPFTGEPYKLRRPEGLEVQKGSALSKVPLLHLHCREMVIPNVAKFLSTSGEWHEDGAPWAKEKPSLLRFIAPMPPHMKISWNVMSSYLV